MNTDKVIILVDANPHLTVKKIQEILCMSHGSVVAHLRDYVSRMDVWTPHELSNKYLQQHLECLRLAA